MRHDHESDYDRPRGNQEGDQEGRDQYNRNRGERDERFPRPRQNNYPQDRWPECDESTKNNTVGRSENLRGRRNYEESFNPARYQFDEQDPRYYAEENRLRRERMWEEQEREARHRERQNQYSSDRWPEQDEYQSRDTDNGQHPSRRRYYEDERRKNDERHYDAERRSRYGNPER